MRVEKAMAASRRLTAGNVDHQEDYQINRRMSRMLPLQKAGRALFLLAQTPPKQHAPRDLWRLVECQLKRAYGRDQR